MTGRDVAMQRALVMKGILLDHGVPEVSIELQDGRPGSGDTWNLCKPVALTSHHIASRPTVSSPTPGLSLVKRGRSDLPGPLANGTAGVDLVYRILTFGMANHSGEGGPITVSGPMGAYTIPEDLGRAYLWGTEYEGGYDNATWDKTYVNTRTEMEMTFREFMGRCNAGLAEAIWAINGKGKKASRTMDLRGYHLEHKTWAPTRKVDRLDYSTDRGRTELHVNSQFHGTSRRPISPGKHVSLRNLQRAAKGNQREESLSVRRVQYRLNKKYDMDLVVDGFWGRYTTKAYKQHQRAAGARGEFVDGVPTLRDLMALSDGRWTIRK